MKKLELLHRIHLYQFVDGKSLSEHRFGGKFELKVDQI